MSSKQTKEIAFESYVEEILIKQSGWTKGKVSDWDKELALFPSHIVSFLKDTQPELWKEMQKLHGDSLSGMIVEAVVKELTTKGALNVLRHGFKFYGKTFRLAYFKPAHGLNEEILALYKKNNLTVTRQVPCNPANNETIDVVLSVNGLPVATCELKNPMTGQTWQHAIRQYRDDRNPNCPLFQFKRRALVHFAADPDEIHMSTKLDKGKTFFLPFNRGSNPGEVKCGKGNPQHKSGYRTGYFWEGILHRDTFLEILGSFMFLETREDTVEDGSGSKKRVKRETMIFPRYHQLDAVRLIVETARKEGAGNNYLIQHSAGSGKTNSISWLSHRLASLHTANDKKIYDCVIVISDRTVLDRQLQDAVYQIEHAQGVVKAIDEDSKQLANALIDGTKIVITTLQKFPFVLRGLLRAAGAESAEKATKAEKEQAKEWERQIASRNYAVIIDEAHSSQTGETARELKAILGATAKKKAAKEEEEEESTEDILNSVLASRGKQPNISFFAFTATPKAKTLEIFGRKSADGLPKAFHLYSMRQAIEEGFILDVLSNYTEYKTFYKLVKAIAENPHLPKKKGVQAIAKFMSLHPHNIAQKTEIMIEHFRTVVKPKIGGKAKAMVVTSSRLHAVRYYQAFQQYLKDKKYSDIHPLVAFSGKVKDPKTGLEYTEPGMNKDIVTGRSISEKQLPEYFETDDYQVLLVANKYQTGFDQPLLHTMYVDKRLDGVQAVQTLSRLNRTYPGKDKPFVLDFVNETEDIKKAFQPYYDKTDLIEPVDPQKMDALKHELDDYQVYHQSEVEAFANIFYRPKEKQSPADHANMNKQLQPAVDRYKACDEKTREAFRDKLSAYVRLYAFLSQVIPYGDADLEKLYSFGRFLLRLLPAGTGTPPVQIVNEVGIQFYRLERVYSGSIDLAGGTSAGIKSPTDIGTGKAKEEIAPLDEIIKTLNDKFGTNFSKEDRLFLDQMAEKATKDEHVISTAMANPLDKFRLGIEQAIADLFIQRMSENDSIVTRYMDDKDFQKSIFRPLTKHIYDTIHRRQEKHE